MLEEGDLKVHLKTIRDYYALGRGELFHQFIAISEQQTKDGGPAQNVHNLNLIFLETARKMYGENDKSYLKFELSTSKTTISNRIKVFFP